jgi:uroporphyrin-III C-methyltransferase
VHVVSRAGHADALASDHMVANLGAAALLHAGRPTVVCVGIGATAVRTPQDSSAARANPSPPVEFAPSDQDPLTATTRTHSP